MAILFALLSLFGWGVGDIFVTVSCRRLGALSAFFWGWFLSLILVSFYIPFAGPVTSLTMFGLAFLIQIIHMLANLSYLRGLEVGNASLIGALAGSFSMVVVVLSVLLFHETLSNYQLIGIALVIIGILLVSFQFDQLKTAGNGLFADKSLLYGLGAMFGWGFAFTFIRIPVEAIGWFYAGYPIYPLVFLLPLLKPVRQKIRWQRLKTQKALYPLLAFVFLITIADFSYNIGISYGLSSLVAPVSGSYPVLFVLLTRLVFGETLSRQQGTGVIFALIGIILITSQTA